MAQLIAEFNPTLPPLSLNQKKVLDLLIEAARLIAPIYALQDNQLLDGANFYPPDVTKDEVEAAAKLDPAILSPYTIVERVDGKLKAIPYHEKYADLLKPVADKLKEAAKVSDSVQFADCLLFQADALLEGKYNEAQIKWMKNPPYLIDIVIGPIERYDDSLFFTKTSYQAWVGVMDEEATDNLNEYKEAILSARRKTLMPSEKVDYYDKVQTRIDDVLIFSGLSVRNMFLGVNLPNDPNLMEKYGSEITIFKQVNEYRLEEEVLPVFSQIFDPRLKAMFSKHDLEQGSLANAALHEIAHTYLRYRNSEKNLKDLFPIIDELAAYVMGMKVCGSLLLKDTVTEKELESIMIAYVAKSFYLVMHDTSASNRHYTISGAIFLNFMLESGGLTKSKNVSWPNFTKMFFSINELGSILERMLFQGTREDAEIFIKKYGSFDNLNRFE